MEWKVGVASYIWGVIWYTENYEIRQYIDCISLKYRWGKDSEDFIDLASRPNWNMNAVKELKEFALAHSKEQNTIDYLIRVAKQSTCCKNKVGAVIVNKDHEILSFAYNGAPVMLDDADMLYQTTLHAEERALINLPISLYERENLILYTTLSPCTRCASIILENKISQVKYLFPYSEVYGRHYLNTNGVVCTQVEHKLKLKPFNLEPL